MAVDGFGLSNGDPTDRRGNRAREILFLKKTRRPGCSIAITGTDKLQEYECDQRYRGDTNRSYKKPVTNTHDPHLLFALNVSLASVENNRMPV